MKAIWALLVIGLWLLGPLPSLAAESPDSPPPAKVGEEAEAPKDPAKGEAPDCSAGDACLRTSRELLGKGEMAMAIRMAERHLESHQDDPEAMRFLLGLYRRSLHRNRLRDVLETAEGVMEENSLLKEGLENMETQLLDKTILENMDRLKTGDLSSLLSVDNLKRFSDPLAMVAMYEKMGDIDGMMGGLERVLAVNPENGDVLLKLAMLHARKGDEARAEEHFRKHLESGAGGLSLLSLYGRAYGRKHLFGWTALSVVFAGSAALLLFLLGGGKARETRARWLFLIPALLVAGILSGAGFGWFQSRSLASFLTLGGCALAFVLAGLALVFLVAGGPLIRGAERLLGRLWDGAMHLFSGKLSGRLAHYPTGFQVVMLILIPVLALAILSVCRRNDIRIGVVTLAGISFFTVIGALALRFLKNNPSLGRTIKFLSLFNTLPFLFVFLYLAGGIMDKFLQLSFSSLDPWEVRMLTASMILYGFGLAFAMYLAAIQTQAILKPVTDLTRGVRRVQSGELDISLPVSSSDELGVLERGFNQMVEGLRQREFIRSTFGKFVDPRVVESVLEKGSIDLGGHASEVVVLFTDIRGFTSLSEKVTPQDLVETLNDYFTRMVKIVEDQGGIVNKFIGDAMMVVWGGIVDDEPDAARAIRAGLAMQAELLRFNREMEAKGHWAIGMGVGVNRGEVIAGHLGSRDRLEWTVMGDNVNLAQRAESNAKRGQVLVSPDTFEPVAHLFHAERLEPITVKGKEKPIAFYNVTGEKAEKPESLDKTSEKKP